MRGQIWCGRKVCIWQSDSPDNGRVGIVIQLSTWYGEPVATVQFLEVDWDESDHDHFYVSELLPI